MKHFTWLTFVLAIVLSSISCNGQVNKSGIEQIVPAAEVSVYYFHFTLRCATCLAVEDNARKAVETLYPNEITSGEYLFTSLNLDEAGTKEMADKLGVGGQTLLIVREDKKIDITSEGFLNARDPEKMQQAIKSAVEKVLL